MTDLIIVQSSNLAAVGYDQKMKILFIKFKGKDAVYEYHDVPADVYEAMMAAPSIGSFYAREIKKQYPSNISVGHMRS